mmetsp:Transcript_7900/g.16505  ORF Transcript_7900/g.16505 Transcript_7900/m.16505 type:complete len:544 (-) Transcript_7900:194-1825(-)
MTTLTHWDRVDSSHHGRAFKAWLMDRTTSEEFNAASILDRSALRTQFEQQQQQELELTYTYGGANGINPNEYHAREAATSILEELPLTVEAFKNSEATLRVLLFGPPASGKTSMIGNIYVTLQERYPFTPVYYVNAFARNGAYWRNEIYNAIARVEICVVLLDDAQEWYGFRDFFGLFKGTGRLLVAAATYSVGQFNPQTPVEFQLRKKANLAQHEITSLLTRLGVDPTYHDKMVEWFGDIYGRYHFLVPSLFQRWNKMRGEDPKVALDKAFFASATVEDEANKRFLPVLDATLKPLLLRVWEGTATDVDYTTLMPYGILKKNREWSCDYVCRKYFFDLFQLDGPQAQLDFNNESPKELELASLGFGAISWNQLKMSSQSSPSGFPIENIWQTVFYSAIGQFIPRPYTFCKEYAITSGSKSGSVDFVLRNGGTRAIEFLIKSDRVGLHHERFETGAYKSLCLSGSYLVVDIKPWNNQPEIHEVSDSRRLEVATECFHDSALNKMSRRLRHAVFLVSNDLSRGVLFTYNPSTSRAEVVQPSGLM